MPKMKSHSSSKKRFSFTKTGKVKKMSANRAHCLTGKSSKRKLSLKGASYADSTNTANMKSLLPYG
ncbi:MAG: 50S ribosomal protein L35 [Clostridia bacterium]